MGRFTFDGRSIPIEPGDTVGSALHRAGVRVIARSLKYHRPRGLYCNLGSCGSCSVDVDGVPNVPACMAPARDGARVRSQNRVGTARHDLLGVVDKVFWDGFDPHGAFTRPRLLNELFLKGVRFMSGLGRPPAPGTRVAGPLRHALAADELIVGAGRQGLLRAKAAAGPGRRILLVDEMAALGGTARWNPMEGEGRSLAAAAPSWPGLEAWTRTLCFGLYREDGNLVAGLMRPGEGGLDLWEVTAPRITLATGAHDGAPLFPNNDLPGILSLRGALRLMGEHRVVPGLRVVGHGAPLPKAAVALLQAAGSDVVAQGEVEAARGGHQVEAARLRGQWVACDAVLCHLPTTPRVELYQQAGCRLGWERGVLAPACDRDGATSRPGLFAALPEAAA